MFLTVGLIALAIRELCEQLLFVPSLVFLLCLSLKRRRISFFVTFEPVNMGYQSILRLLSLAIFPTILGIYCTTSAFKYLPAPKVPVIELSEPLFAMLFV